MKAKQPAFQITKQEALKNIKLQTLINFFGGATFLLPIITLFYTFKGLDLFQIILISNVSTFLIFLLELPTSVFADTSGRTKSLRYSVYSNFLGSLFILFFPNLVGFIAASACSAFYWSFWSGTGQAFLDDNLKILGREESFGRNIGKLMFYEQVSSFIVPLISSFTLLSLDKNGYYLLAFLDVISALVLVYLVLKLKEPISIKPLKSFKDHFKSNLNVARAALLGISKKGKIRLILVYRIFTNHLSYFLIIILPVLANRGMPDWYSGIITGIGAILLMLAVTFSSIIGEKFSYQISWVFSSVLQGSVLLICGLLLPFIGWPILIMIFFLFKITEGLIMPAWNHVVVTASRGIAIATTLSLTMSFYCLYSTVGNQIFAAFPVQIALIVIGSIILLTNILIGKRLIGDSIFEQNPQKN